jgi:hypothetical protein
MTSAPKSFHGHRRPRLYRGSEHNTVEMGLIEKVYEGVKKEKRGIDLINYLY